MLLSQQLKEEKLQKLEQMRKDKELREKNKRDKELAAQKALEDKKNAPLQSEYVRKVLENQANPLIFNQSPGVGAGEATTSSENAGGTFVTLNELKLSTFVVEMEFLPKPKIETYEREIQCDLYEEGIVKLPEHANDGEQEEHVHTLAAAGMDRSIKHSAGLISSHTPDTTAPYQDQNDFDRDHNTENDDASQRHPDFKLLTKDESKAIMLTKEFEQFMNKTSKMVERALDGSDDVIGPSSFFEEVREGGGDEGDEERVQVSMQSKEKLVPLFTFQEGLATNRTITSIEWSQKVRDITTIFQ